MNINFLIFILLSHHPHPQLSYLLTCIFAAPSQFNSYTVE